jgi:hypothetical protein
MQTAPRYMTVSLDRSVFFRRRGAFWLGRFFADLDRSTGERLAAAATLPCL